MTIASHISKVVNNATPTRDDALAILEIAYLTIVSDGAIQPEEETTLRALARTLGAEAAIDALFAGGGGDRQTNQERLRVLAASLSGAPAKRLAYKAAVALSMSDLASSDREFEFDLELIDALGLAQETADELTGEVVEAVQPDA